MNENPTTGDGAEIGGYRPQRPFETAFDGWRATREWSNTVTVRHTLGYDPEREQDPGDDAEWWADGADRHLVEIDTNYKATRPGQHPVQLTRGDAARLASAVLQAVGDTFHYLRAGRLRPTEAVELLRALEDVEGHLAELRSHALSDLITGALPDVDEHDEQEEQS